MDAIKPKLLNKMQLENLAKAELPPGLEPSALSFALAYGGIALASSYLAALTIHLTFGRGFLGEPRSVLIVGMSPCALRTRSV